MARSISRREFVAAAASLSSGLVLRPLAAQHADATQPESRLAHDPQRPQFHLLPAHNWMNDPNGPIYFKGQYHLFFQYNPRAAVWGNMSWNHATSPDMLHWTHAGLALTETPGGPDADGCFSGSCLAVQEHGRQRVYAIYTGVVKDKIHATIQAEDLRESQCLAWSDDPQLRTWSKQPEPVIAKPPAALKVTGFRDPAIWKSGDSFYLTVGSGIRGVGGCVLLYRSHDLRHWEYLHVLTGGHGTGQQTANPVSNGEMWECPDFFALDGGHVLIYSTMGKVYWQSGKLDEESLTFQPQQTGLLDLDAFYAPKTQLDAHGRRILWGWVPERRPEAAMIKAGWSGMTSLPRLLHLDPDGMLRMTILPKIVTLRGEAVPITNSRTGLLAGASGEVRCSGLRGTSFTLKINVAGTPLINIAYDAATHAMQIDEHKIALSASDKPALHAFLDCSVIELIVSQRISYTKRFYLDTASPSEVSVEGATLQLWKVLPISPNRLTTPATSASMETY